jgi:hypothetical protein
MAQDPEAENVRHTVQVARGATPVTGTYVIEGDAVSVQYGGQTKIALLDGLDAESRARMTLGEMVPWRSEEWPSKDRPA